MPSTRKTKTSRTRRTAEPMSSAAASTIIHILEIVIWILKRINNDPNIAQNVKNLLGDSE